jgi:phosphatidylserine/phosphatidylglycerophosphate/cardiolipin synthase-like enzyme
MFQFISASGHRELSHAKIIYAKDKWFYIGSHNCTESAWGSHTWIGRVGKRVAKLDVRNFEVISEANC